MRNVCHTQHPANTSNLLTRNSITCLYTNAQCLTNKLAELTELCSCYSPDLIAVTETWFEPQIPDSELSIPNMSLLRRDRPTYGGGVILYHRQNLRCSTVPDANLELEDTIWCSLELDSGEACIIGVIYRSPHTMAVENEKLLEVIRYAGHKWGSRLLIMGDFNLPNLLHRSTHSLQSLDYKFREVMDLIPLYNHVFDYTRRRGSEQPSILDLILTSEETAVESIQYKAPLGRSDHLVLLFEYVYSVQRLNDHLKLVRRVDYLNLREVLRDSDNDHLDWSSPDSHCSTLTSFIKTKVEESSHFVPKRKTDDFRFVLRSRTKKWLALRNAAWAQHKLRETETSWTYFCKIRNHVTNLIREDKEHHQLRLVARMQANPKVLYRIVNTRTKVKPGVLPLRLGDRLTESVEETANELAQFYSRVFTPKSVVHNNSLPSLCTAVSLTSIVIHPELVRQHLRHLNTKKSPGADGITCAILKLCEPELCRPLCDLFIHSLDRGAVPMDWKMGVISPIYKGGSRSEAVNYRPVTLLPVISKVLERIICEQITAHLESQKLLSVAQHGFRRSYSCLSNLLTTLNDWTAALNEGTSIHACYLDMSKAFDRVDHDLLLCKLKQVGIAGTLLAWLESYLSDRKVTVRIDGVSSRVFEATSGVPQGSVLGPLLFLIYVNDLPDLVASKLILFADDVKIWMRIKSVADCERLQLDLDVLHDWSVRNKLPFNPKKCKMLQLGKIHPFLYRLGSEELSWTTGEKDLGVWICSSLKNKLHCENIHKRASRLVGMLRRIFGRFTVQSFPRVVKTYILPIMEYASPAWSPWMKGDINLLEKVYRRATKLVRGFHNLPYAERLSRLDLMSPLRRRLRSDLILAYKILHTTDHPLQHLLQYRCSRTTRSSSASLEIEHTRINCRRYFYSVRVAFLWNALPDDVKHATCVRTFKEKLDVYIWTNDSIAPNYLPV